MIRARRARILATLGPASRGFDKVEALARAGVDVFRLNFSHGTHDDHAAALQTVREVDAKLGRPLGVLADLQGPKLRLGMFKAGKIAVAPGQSIRLDLDSTPGDDTRVQVPHPELLAAMRPGVVLLIDDGKVRLRVTASGPGWADTEVIQGTALSDKKGVALPGAIIPMPAMTDKDHKDLQFALRIGVDWVALSFVQHAADMADLRKIVQGRAAVMAKIEKPAALDNIESILDLCDGIMVARGDLGVELEPEEVPVAQKMLIRAARNRGVPVVVATQMLESMISSATPTRAEASDVANAVYEGADAVMLSAESASGAYPIEAATMMNRIIERVEQDPNWPSLMRAEHAAADDDADALVAAAYIAAEASPTACLVAFTSTGGTARRLARERPLQPMVALTPDPKVARKLALVWGMESRLAADPKDLDDMTSQAVDAAVRLGLAKPSARVLILAGTPFGAPGAANLLRFAHAPVR